MPPAPPEALESRALLAYSPLGYSLPDLTVQAVSAPVAAWGGTVAITAIVDNLGASTIPEPFNQAQPGQSTTLPNQGLGGTSHADSPPTTLNVYASNHPGKGPYVFVGDLIVPSIHQNDLAVVRGDVNLPAKPAGFPYVGTIYFTYTVDPNHTFVESKYSNNTFASRQPVELELALPDLELVGFSVPSPLVPGQTIVPTIQIANLGAAATNLQGPVTVQLVAALTPTYGPTDQVLATYTVANIPPLSEVSTADPLAIGQALGTPSNVVTLDGLQVTLPSTPGVYYLGVKINPKGTIIETGKHAGTSTFDAVAKVGPPIPGYTPPAPTTGTSTGTSTPITPVAYVFPNPLPGASSAGGTPIPLDNVVPVGTTTTATVALVPVASATPAAVPASTKKKSS